MYTRVYTCICMYTCLYIYILSIYIYICIYRYTCPCIYTYIHTYVCVRAHVCSHRFDLLTCLLLFLLLYVCKFMQYSRMHIWMGGWMAVSACLCVFVSACLPVCLSVFCLFVCLSVCLSVRLSVCPSVRLSVCLSVKYLSIPTYLPTSIYLATYLPISYLSTDLLSIDLFRWRSLYLSIYLGGKYNCVGGRPPVGGLAPCCACRCGLSNCDGESELWVVEGSKAVVMSNACRLLASTKLIHGCAQCSHSQ